MCTLGAEAGPRRRNRHGLLRLYYGVSDEDRTGRSDPTDINGPHFKVSDCLHPFLARHVSIFPFLSVFHFLSPSVVLIVIFVYVEQLLSVCYFLAVCLFMLPLYHLFYVQSGLPYPGFCHFCSCCHFVIIYAPIVGYLLLITLPHHFHRISFIAII